MSPSYLTNKEAVLAIQEIEQDSDLFRFKIGRWCAWPIVRWHVIRDLQCRPDDEPTVSAREKSAAFYVKQLFSDIRKIWASTASEVMVSTLSRFRTSIKDGHSNDIFFDRLIAVEKTKFLKQELGIGTAAEALPKFQADISLECIEWLSEALARRWVSKKIAEISAELIEKIQIHRPLVTITVRVLARKLQAFWWKKLFFKIILSRASIRTVLFTSHPRALIAAARELGIFAVEMQHGCIENYSTLYSYTSSAHPYKSHMTIPNKIFLFGDFWKERLQKSNFWSEELCVVGNPSVESLHKREKAAFLDKKLPRILVSTQGFSTQELLNFLDEVVLISGKNIELIVKLHPLYDRSLTKWQELASKYDSIKIVDATSGVTTLELLESCDYHTSIWSSVHFEAIAMKVPTIILGLTGWENVEELISLKWAELARTPKEFCALIKRGLLEKIAVTSASEKLLKQFSPREAYDALFA